MIFVTREQMEKVDLKAVESGISLMRMFDTVGQNVSEFIIDKLNPKKVIVAYGGGHNGGGGLSIARYLIKKNINVEIIGAEEKLKDATAEQFGNLDEDVVKAQAITSSSDLVVVDALLGYGINRDPKARYSELINQLNSVRVSGVKVVSLDLPSGLDATTGFLYTPHVEADYTIALGLPKVGLKEARKEVGELWLSDIGITDDVFKAMNIPIERYFERGPLVKIW